MTKVIIEQEATTPEASEDVLFEQAIEEKHLEHAHALSLILSDKLTYSLLELAIKNEDLEYVSYFICQISDLNTPEGGSLVWQALGVRNTEMAAMLVEAGADLSIPNPRDPSRGITLLHEITYMINNENLYNLALLMMNHGADVNAIDDMGSTPLHYAVYSDYSYKETRYSFVLAMELVNRGARIDAVDNKGNSVIDIAKKNFWYDGQLCPMLIALADVDDDIKCQWIIDSIITLTANKNEKRAIGLRSLLELGFPILTMNNLFTDLSKALYYVVEDCKDEQLEVLLDYGLDINAKIECDDVVTDALNLAIRKNLKKMTKILIARGADIHAIDNLSKGQPIHTACQSNSIENVRLLLRLGVDINIADEKRLTPYSIIDVSPLSDHLRECLIEKLAILSAQGKKINEKDWQRIRKNPVMLRYYKKCLNELQKMKTIKINFNITLFCLLIENVKNISGYARNLVFTENFHQNIRKIKAAFPIYCRELEYVVKMAETRKDILILKEQALLNTLNLPQLVVTKIVKYVCFDELIDFEKLYHVSMMQI